MSLLVLINYLRSYLVNCVGKDLNWVTLVPLIFHHLFSNSMWCLSWFDDKYQKRKEQNKINFDQYSNKCSGSLNKFL